MPAKGHRSTSAIHHRSLSSSSVKQAHSTPKSGVMQSSDASDEDEAAVVDAPGRKIAVDEETEGLDEEDEEDEEDEDRDDNAIPSATTDKRTPQKAEVCSACSVVVLLALLMQPNHIVNISIQANHKTRSKSNRRWHGRQRQSQRQQKPLMLLSASPGRQVIGFIIYDCIRY